MASTTLTELTDLAKDFFTNVYEPLLNPETPLRAQFGALKNAMFTGKGWIFGVKTGFGGGAANVGAGLTLPDPTEGTYDQGTATLVRTYTTMQLDAFAIEVTKRQQGSFRPALAEVMQDRLQAHDLEVNRQLFCKGGGQLCLLNGDPSGGTTVTVDADYDIANDANGTRHIFPGDQFEIYDPTLATKRAGGPYTVSSITSTTVFESTANINAAAADNDVIVRATDDTDNVTAGEAGGLLESVLDSGTFESIPGTGQWRSARSHNSGTARDISDSLVMQMIEEIRSQSRRMPNLAVTSPGIVLNYSELFLPLRRLQGQDVQLKGGYKPIASIITAGAAIPVISDVDCPRERLFLLNTDAFRMADMVGTDWADLDGAIFDRVVGQDGIVGYLRKYWQLITIARNANGIIEDVTDITGLERRV